MMNFKDEQSLSVHSANSSDSSIFDDESETEDSSRDEKKPVRRRSDRVRKSRISDLGYFEVKKSKFSVALSSISDAAATSDEIVAHCLIMMSRDKYWRRVEMEYQEKAHDQEVEEVEEEEEDSDVDERKVVKNKVRGKYRCETCNKLFRSYQALGGHRANHKKVKHENPPRLNSGRVVLAEEKVHECPFCPRVFSSGQALGGHKRSHFINGGANLRNVVTSSPVENEKFSRTGDALDIDLNLPAPDDEYDRVTVSGIEFMQPVKC